MLQASAGEVAPGVPVPAEPACAAKLANQQPPEQGKTAHQERKEARAARRQRKAKRRQARAQQAGGLVQQSVLDEDQGNEEQVHSCLSFIRTHKLVAASVVSKTHMAAAVHPPPAAHMPIGMTEPSMAL